MAAPVVIVASAGAPFVNVATGAPAATPVDAHGAPIVLVASGAPPITLVNADGSLWEEPE